MNDVQKKILSIYKEIKKILDNHQIPFYAIGGTCIGAVRHHGFIPWDDDLDIAIPIQHFDQFLDYARTELPKNLRVYVCDDIKHYRYIFAKIHDIETTFIEKAELKYPEAQKGIFVDIMPISSVPFNSVKKERFVREVRVLSIMNFIRRYPLCEMGSLKKSIVWLLMRPICLFVDYDYFSNKWLKMLKQYPLGSTELTGYTWFDGLKRLIFPIEAFRETIQFPFEDTSISCPVGYDEYLTIQFGDYMKIPPESEQIIHSIAILDTSKPFSYYSERTQNDYRVYNRRV